MSSLLLFRSRSQVHREREFTLKATDLFCFFRFSLGLQSASSVFYAASFQAIEILFFIQILLLYSLLVEAAPNLILICISSKINKFFSFRYAPYPMPTAAQPGVQQVPQAPTHHQQQQQQHHHHHHQAAAAAALAAGPVQGNPYQGYSLTNVDMSSFQGVDWGMYGMGMYV